jgi:presequence protease
MMQERRERLLDVTKEQVREAAQKYIVDALENRHGRMVFLGEKKTWVDGAWEEKTMEIPVPEPEVQVDVKAAAWGS